ncbi:MAG: hydroxymethylbilane synthase [Pirellulaceae bacterium]
MTRIRLGTRASALAIWQANWVTTQLENNGHSVEIVNITTSGDTHSIPLGVGSGQGVFTKEIQRAVLDGRVDLAVHSLKDLPTEPIEGLQLIAVPRRASNLDCLVSSKYWSLADLPRQAKVGTGSARRLAQLLHERPDLDIQNIRGNVGTRLSKLDDGEFDAILLAEAGLRRLGFDDRIREIFPPRRITPAVGQGALGLEIREADQCTADVVQALDDLDTHAAIRAERTMLRHLRGGCLAPVGGWARIEQGRLVLLGVVCSLGGEQRLRIEADADISDARSLGEEVARQLKSLGSDRLLAEARGENS